MKGFVPTPRQVVDLMVEKLFSGHPPTGASRVLDPGCGQGAFIEGIVRWCRARSSPLPKIVGIEANPAHLTKAHERLGGIEGLELRNVDFLGSSEEQYDYIVGNPPYVPITGLSEEERAVYRRTFTVAKGRFDLYLLFFEQALRLLTEGGRLTFVTPEKYLYVETARKFRALLSNYHVEELHLLNEQTFPGLVTYPLVSTVVATPLRTSTVVRNRNSVVSRVSLGRCESSWLPVILGTAEDVAPLRLADVCTRISCGVATGADSVFVLRSDEVATELLDFAYPTISGRELSYGQPLSNPSSLLLPYDKSGALIDEDKLGPLGAYLNDVGRREPLLRRTCARRKAWYAFHETPPMGEILRPKLLCKDITPRPHFVIDREGTTIPRHSVYYAVPRDPGILDKLATYLNGESTQRWMRAHCQRAANDFVRLQSTILKRVPLTEEFLASLSEVKVGALSA